MDERDPDIAMDISRSLRDLLQAGRGVQATLARRLGVGVTDVEAVSHLVESAEPLGTVELGNRLGIRSASATVLADRLEAAGHLRRHSHPGDRRRVVLRPTDSARAEVRAALGPLLVALGGIVADLDDEQAVVVRDFLRDATRAIGEFTDPTG
ncbi:MarR family transcriptional regulator [Umezawaea sp. Da 62-37]|uniref:MarR family winged helix-turn-helix transcriptional regulator n=1 Tax=Umezawaea sp. Da 62-37 TaxID=3075927 RepID=UPI0028F6E626|nr:MarR family transcriptional regulator [Umezawaea sp. Da 62-37]WNV88195.1 MarR family transcriptional regulator [Umezawaea sp. Da 62-37]